MFLPDERTLAGRLTALASAAELGLLAAEYQQKQQKQQRRRQGSKGSTQSDGVMFEHAPRFVGSKGGTTFIDQVSTADWIAFFMTLDTLKGSRGSLSALAFHRLLELEVSSRGTGRAMFVVCPFCFGVFFRPQWLLEGAPDFCSEECRQSAEQALQRARKPLERHFLRFGLWPTSPEKSIDFQQGIHEPGVSVYDAFYDPEAGCYRLDTAKVTQYARRAKSYLPMLFDRHIFVVTGDETEPGIDGEPCLRNVRLIAPAIWRNHQIVPVPLERLLAVAEALGFGKDGESRR